MHRVAVLVLPEVVPYDLAIPVEVFSRARDPKNKPAYRVRVCGPIPRVRATGFDVVLDHGLGAVSDADTVFVPGVQDPFRPLPDGVGAALRAAVTAGARVASICSGAFVLAAAGVLDGRRATTHWLGAGALAARHPRIDVDPDVLFLEDGGVCPAQFLVVRASALTVCRILAPRNHGLF